VVPPHEAGLLVENLNDDGFCGSGHFQKRGQLIADEATANFRPPWTAQSGCHFVGFLL
jgi:hypothetical protein